MADSSSVDNVTATEPVSNSAVGPKPLILQDVAFPEVLQTKVNHIYRTRLLRDAADEHFAEAQGILSVLHGAIDEAVYCRMPNLKTVSNFGAGYDHVDVQAATTRGITCGHTPGVRKDV